MALPQTELRLYPLGAQDKAMGHSYIPLASARGCTQTLEAQIEQGLRFVTGDQPVWRPGPETVKYVSRITCTDTFPIAVEQLGPGTLVGVDCIVRLMTPVLQPMVPFVLPRPAVPDSLWWHPPMAAHDAPAEASLPPEQVYDQTKGQLTLSAHQTSGHISYRPRLVMMVMSLVIKAAEWEGATTWDMQLQET